MSILSIPGEEGLFSFKAEELKQLSAGFDSSFKNTLKDTQINTAKILMNRLRKEIKCEDKSVQTCTDITQEFRTKIIELTTELTQKVERINLLEYENRNISKYNKDVVSKLNELKDKIADFEIKIEALEQARRNLVNENNKLVHTNATLNADKANFLRKINNLERVINELNAKMLDLELLCKNPEYLMNQLKQLYQNNKELFSAFIKEIKEDIIEDNSDESDLSRNSKLGIVDVNSFEQMKKSSFSSQRKQIKSKNPSSCCSSEEDKESIESDGNFKINEDFGKRLDIVNEERSDYDSRFFDEESRNQSRLNNNPSISCNEKRELGITNNSVENNETKKIINFSKAKESNVSASSKKLVKIPSESASRFETDKSINSYTTESIKKGINLNKDYNTDNLEYLQMDVRLSNKNNTFQSGTDISNNLRNLKSLKHEENEKQISNLGFDRRGVNYFGKVDSFKTIKRMTTSYMDMKTPHSEKCGPNCRHLRQGDGLYDQVPEGTYILKQKEHVFGL